ncbi:hypothetical protein [Leifsonia sp. Leaf264]|uniref:hypothetical protein n=1 Tax=Leifsonia sp. Leaf264 TaxID=1736314 RepID=UPI000701F204|nr:hypothetical protein [Leifsonia sp. Leaf264]KQO98444.1 hypothetical protein ASF30_10305 [Leifsonia sp. Leaf264]
MSSTPEFELGETVGTMFGSGKVVAIDLSSDGNLKYMVDVEDGRRILASAEAFGEPPAVEPGRLAAEEAVEAFLTGNYPCTCGDPECPGHRFEASMIVQIVVDHMQA